MHICCNAGQCRSSLNGPPTCLDNIFNPSPGGLSPGNQNIADPSEEIKDVIKGHNGPQDSISIPPQSI